MALLGKTLKGRSTKVSSPQKTPLILFFLARSPSRKKKHQSKANSKNSRGIRPIYEILEGEA